MIGLDRLERNYEEKRDFIRMNLNSQCQFQKKSLPNINHQAITRNLSGSGILIETGSYLQLNEEITITLNPTSGQFEPLEVNAKIIRIDEINPNQFLAACKIIVVT